MTTLANILGIDLDSPSQRRAMALVEQDRALLQRLIAIRRENYTQQQVADILGVKQATVASFERYDNDPKLSTVRRYAHAIGALVEHRVTPPGERLEGWSQMSGTGSVVVGTNAPQQFAVAAPAGYYRTDFVTAA